MIPLEVYKEKDTRRTMLCVAYMPQRGLPRLFSYSNLYLHYGNYVIRRGEGGISMSSKTGTTAEVVRKILSLLPGSDCKGLGGCGRKTCLDCAEAIADGESVALCPACDQDRVDAIAEALGTETEKARDQVAFVFCSGSAAGKERAGQYKSCEEAVEKGFKRGECKDGCVGVGSCVDSCEFGAMSLEDGRIVIDKDKCTGCGACANKAVCPQTIIRMVPREATNFIPCSSTEEDDELTRRICGHGCISCGECERACPEGAVSIVNNHAVIDYDKCAGCVACTVKCRKKIIVDTLHDLTKVKEKVAFVKCSGGYKASEVYKKMGLTSCEEAIEKISPKDHELCTTGCCGLGSCTKVCRYDAIHVVNGTAVVDPEKCVGCKDCTYACPKHIITIVPYTGQKQVPCSSTADYEDKAKVCWSSCIACEDCVNNCPNGAIYMEDKHAVIDHELCENCNVCQYVCSRRIIKEMEVPEYTYLQREALGIRKGE